MIEYDEDEHVKETFAHFGRAFYMSNVFEAGLASAIFQMEFLTAVKAKHIASGRNTFDQKQYEADLEEFLKQQHAQTLGNLIKRAEKTLPFSEDIQKVIKEAKKRRDFLAHHYFRERAVEFSSRKGRDAMISELTEANSIFILADGLLDKIIEPHRKELGFTDKLLEEEMAAMMREASMMDGE